MTHHAILSTANNARLAIDRRAFSIGRFRAAQDFVSHGLLTPAERALDTALHLDPKDEGYNEAPWEGWVLL